MSETFNMCDVDTGLRKTMMDREVARTLGHIRTARTSRLIESNASETKRLMDECEHLTGAEWMNRQAQITELFLEHARLCEVFGEAEP